MKKNAIILSLALAMLVQLLAGCGGGASTSQPGSSAAENSVEVTAQAQTDEEAAAPEQTAEAAEETSAEETGEPEWEYTPISYPLTPDDPTLSIWFLGTLMDETMYSDWSEHHALAYIQEKTGISLELIPNSFQFGASAMDLMLASGDYADLICDFKYTTGMDGAIADGVAVNVADELPEYAPDYYRYLIADDGALLKKVTTDAGNIGAFVKVGAIPEQTEGPMTFQYMLDETGFQVENLNTIDAYEEYLTAVKNKYGMSSPLYLPGDFIMDKNVIASGFGVALKVAANSGELPWYVEDGQVKFGYLEDGFAEYVSRLHQWYEDGIIDSDTASHAVTMDDYLRTAIVEQVVGVFQRPSGMMDMLSDTSGAQVVALPYPSLDGTPVEIDGATDTTTGENGTVITTGCEDLETAIQFMNYLYSEEYEIPSNYGLEGESFDYDAEGNPVFQEWLYSDGRTVRSYINDYILTPTAMVSMNVVYPGLSQATLDAKTVWGESVSDGMVYPTNAAMNEEEKTTYSMYAGDIVALVQEHTAKFIVGDEPMDSISEFQDMLRSTGIEEMIQVKQSAYDRYME